MKCTKCLKVRHVNKFATTDECNDCFAGTTKEVSEEYTARHLIQEVEKIWLNAWHRELGADKTLRPEERTRLNKLRQMADGENTQSNV